MRILQVCNKPPFPPYDGGSIAMNNITDGLIKEGHDIKLISVNTDKHYVDLQHLPTDYLKNTNIELVYINTRLSPIKALINLLFSKRSYNIVRFESAKMEDKLVKTFSEEEFDIIIIESLFLNHYVEIIRKNSNAKIILRAHNAEFVIWERLAQEATNPLKNKYLSILAKRLKREEVQALGKFDGILTVSDNDKQLFQQLCSIKAIESIPIAIDVTKNINSNYDIEHPSLFFIGAMDWRPNQEGLQWFLDQVWLKLHRLYPNLVFYIAGRGESNWLDLKKYKNVTFCGEVDDATKFFKTKSIMLVPLFSGSGMRVKIIEAMTLGKAIVSTTIGAEGIGCKDHENILIADSEDEYFYAIKDLIENRELYNLLCKNAVKFSHVEFSNSAITKKMLRFINSI